MPRSVMQRSQGACQAWRLIPPCGAALACGRLRGVCRRGHRRCCCACREDDCNGHYQFEIGENLAPRFKIMRKFGEGTFGQASSGHAWPAPLPAPCRLLPNASRVPPHAGCRSQLHPALLLASLLCTRSARPVLRPQAPSPLPVLCRCSSVGTASARTTWL